MTPTEPSPPTPAGEVPWLGPNKVLWLSVLALVVVLVVTYLIVPRQSAPFIYAFF